MNESLRPNEVQINRGITSVGKEDILYRALERKTLCKVLSQAHIYVSIYWLRMHWYIGIPSTVLAAAASVQAISNFQGNYQMISILLSLAVAILAPLLTFLDPNQSSNSHLAASRVYEKMADMYDNFHLKCLLETRSIEEELTELTQINSEYGESKKGLPSCPEWAYQRALKAQDSIKKLIADELAQTGSHDKFITKIKS